MSVCILLFQRGRKEHCRRRDGIASESQDIEDWKVDGEAMGRLPLPVLYQLWVE
jgi:hypothetical protein